MASGAAMARQISPSRAKRVSRPPLLPIISTPIGAEGINYTDGKDVLLARTATEFVERILGLIDRPESVRAIGLAAHALVRDQYAEESIARDLIAFYQRLLGK